MKIIPVLIFSIFLAACQSLGSKKESIPEWWTTPSEDTSEWLYGFGEGRTLNVANQQALANVAGKLKTTISGSLSRRTQETNASASDYIDRQMSSEIQKVSLGHFETVRTETLSGRVLTSIRVDKKALIDAWLRQYQAIQNDLDTLLADKQKSRFQWWVAADAFSVRALEGDNLASLISGLTETEMPSNLVYQLNQAINLRAPTVMVKGPQADINRAIVSDLLSQGLRVGNCSKCDLTIEYDTTFSSLVLFGQSVVKMNFSGSLIDERGSVSSNHWVLSASSVSGMESGKKGSIFMAVQKIKSEGLWKAFGMETK
ncbi:LPP20 family lipoprotein [Marinomonas sp. A79]|uniref:LPP20 family lipoprotein n=1 Tax=Marinomonas vulgaris TaxID=2823372 RepID=A0ABS5HEV5_9GAMM|nr:LPP20 family lipoprotein [Marinomonas vulgaris]MBR7889953.1 LPP20 family lipoprotein [Marinomonas vulgaris]